MLYLLSAKGYNPTARDPDNVVVGGLWDPWYDRTFALVVRAPNEARARLVAADAAADHGGDEIGYNGLNPWLYNYLTDCALLDPEGEPGLVVLDFHAA